MRRRGVLADLAAGVGVENDMVRFRGTKEWLDEVEGEGGGRATTHDMGV